MKNFLFKFSDDQISQEAYIESDLFNKIRVHEIPKESFLANICITTSITKREFRGVSITTYGNVDWPSSQHLSTKEQKNELLSMILLAKKLNINAIFLQVRPRSDSFYYSDIEPWSQNLTSQQGLAPDPIWDPLKFAIEQAHLLGIQVHAWINPYRVGRIAEKDSYSYNHFSKRHSEAIVGYGPYLWMDPGNPICLQHIQKVISDIVTRYDIDGIYFDDHFYPFPLAKDSKSEGFISILNPDESTKINDKDETLDFDDEKSWQNYFISGGQQSKSDWRRENINLLVKQTYKTIKSLKPWVQFGISPYGIYRPGIPEGVQGMDQYDRTYSDPIKWIQNRWIDFIAPQIHWPESSTKRIFSKLLNWWTEQAKDKVLIYPNIYVTRIEAIVSDMDIEEIKNQIEKVKKCDASQGQVLHRITSLWKNTKGISREISESFYSKPALPPVPLSAPNTILHPPIIKDLKFLDESIYIEWSHKENTKSNIRSYAIYRCINEAPELLNVVGSDIESISIPLKEIAEGFIGISAIDLYHVSSNILWIKWKGLENTNLF